MQRNPRVLFAIYLIFRCYNLQALCQSSSASTTEASATSTWAGGSSLPSDPAQAFDAPCVNQCVVAYNASATGGCPGPDAENELYTCAQSKCDQSLQIQNTYLAGFLLQSFKAVFCDETNSTTPEQSSVAGYFASSIVGEAATLSSHTSSAAVTARVTTSASSITSLKLNPSATMTGGSPFTASGGNHTDPSSKPSSSSTQRALTLPISAIGYSRSDFWIQVVAISLMVIPTLSYLFM